MKIKYFQDTDTLYIEFRAAEVAETKDLDENTLLDLDRNGDKSCSKWLRSFCRKPLAVVSWYTGTGARLRALCILPGFSNSTDVIGPLDIPNQLKNQMSRWFLSVEIRTAREGTKATHFLVP